MDKWFVAHYDVLKDFSGPVATVIAATAAGLVAIIFGTVQWRIAAAQRDIARDNLRFLLMQRRYAIYDATKSLLTYAAFVKGAVEIDSNRIRQWFVQIEEAHFYFPDDICSHLAQVKQASETFFQHMTERQIVDESDTDKWMKTAQQLAADLKTLRNFYAELPLVFSRPLAFKQLISE